MKKQNLFIFILLVTALISCREVKEAPPIDSNPSIEAYRLNLSPYVMDESIDFFTEKAWYAYDDGNHIIWPNFRVYALRINSEYFKLQILDYYDERFLAGNYKIRVQKEGEAPFIYEFKAQGCGNIYTNPNYTECLKNPETNVFTYVDLNNRTAKKMSAKKAKKNSEWDIAFNGTSVILNSGNKGPGSVRATDLYLYGGFFAGEITNFQRIAEVSFSDQGERFFNQTFDVRRAPYSIPDGQVRAIFENDWFSRNRNDGSHSVINKNWWIVKGGEEGSYAKFRVKDILETKAGEITESIITLEVYSQDLGDSEFGPVQEWELPKISSDVRLIKNCLDLNTRSVVDCSEKSADLLLSISNRSKKRRWRFNVISGAVGPLSFEEMSNWTRGN